MTIEENIQAWAQSTCPELSAQGAVQGTLKSLLQHHSSKASILRLSAFFMVQLSHPYLTTGKTIWSHADPCTGSLGNKDLLGSESHNPPWPPRPHPWPLGSGGLSVSHTDPHHQYFTPESSCIQAGQKAPRAHCIQILPPHQWLMLELPLALHAFTSQGRDPWGHL